MNEGFFDSAKQEYERISDMIKQKELELKKLFDERRPFKLFLESLGIIKKQERVKK